MMNLPPFFFSFDVESIGLHGQHYAVGFVLWSPDGREHCAGHFACSPDNAHGSLPDRDWIAKNIAPIEINCLNPNEVIEKFWQMWMDFKSSGAVMVSDCGWPVEARFLCECIDADKSRRVWDGPYPLFDVSSIALAKGVDPLATHDRLPNELPKHDPVCDARQSMRILLELLSK